MGTDGAIHDVIGLGFGPAGIALAVAIDDAEEALHPDVPPMRALFLERSPSAVWQPGLLLPGSDIQHHFLRDLASPRDPRSRYSFANYLKEHDRLHAFGLFTGAVSRAEWSDYMQWAAREVRQPAQYRREVMGVTPVQEEDRVVALRIHSRDPVTGQRSEHVGRNLVVSTGHIPYLPEPFRQALGERVFHSQRFLDRIEPLAAAGRPSNLVVVGGGQTAAEVIMYLAQRFPSAHIHSVSRGSTAFRLANLGHFSNEAYFPEETDYFYRLDREQRAALFEELYATNYAGVDPEISTTMYRMVYEDRLSGRPRFHLWKRVRVTGMASRGDLQRLSLEEVHTGERRTLEADAVVVCTGFREPRIPPALEPVRHLLRFDEHGDPEVSRSYRLEVNDGVDVGIWLNGLTEWRHGISNATSFSMMAIKAGDIQDDLRRHLEANRARSRRAASSAVRI
jgi:L-ornithine N5-oxygenase